MFVSRLRRLALFLVALAPLAAACTDQDALTEQTDPGLANLSISVNLERTDIVELVVEVCRTRHPYPRRKEHSRV
jgi:hypothetical protein